MMMDRLQDARSASAADSLAVIADAMPHALALDPARIPLAKEWLTGVYLPEWLVEANVPYHGRDLADIEADAQTAWRAHQREAQARYDPAAWPAASDEVRDLVRETMQSSAEAAIRLPIEDLAWSAFERRVLSTVEACIWAIAWRAVDQSPGAAASLVIPAALMPRRLNLQRSAASIVLGVTPATPKVTRRSHVEDGVLFNADAPVLAFMREHLPRVREWGPCSTLGILRDGALIGGVVFNNYYPDIGDVMISAAFSTAAWFRPRTLRRVFAYPFQDLGCRRLTDHVPRKLKPARRFAEKAGFRLEGVKKGGFDGRQDLILYGMSRAECRFLKGT